MPRQNLGIKLILFLLITWGPFSAVCPIVFGQTTTVSVSPSSISASVNQIFTVNVNVSGVSDPAGLYGWEFTLTWNSTLLDTVTVTEGSFLQPVNETFFTYAVNATDGSVRVDCTLTGNDNGVGGDGTLATLTFHVDNAGGCPLLLSEATLVDSQENQIPCLTADGYGTFTVPPDIAVTSINVSPTTLLIGGIVSINVTVQNQGISDEAFNVTTYANSQIIGAQPVSLPSNSSRNLSFVWNTAGFEQGDYTISASASIVPGEVNTTNNSMQAANPVTLLYNGHDIAVVAVDPYQTAVGQGYDMNITIIVKDYGVFSETFNTTAYVNTTAIGTRSVSLNSANRAALTFAWNTASFIKGNYTISAYASPVPNETDTTNNRLVGDSIIGVTIPGDANGDFKVNLIDLVYLAYAYGTIPASGGIPGEAHAWNPNADIDENGVVGLTDLVIVALHYGQHYP